MIHKIKNSLLSIDYNLIITLMLIQFIPTLYMTLRIFFLGQLPEAYSFSIAGQLTWINLLYEVIDESIILPLYYFIGKALNDKREFSNCFKSGLLVTFGIYVVLALLIMLFIKPMLMIMSVNNDILASSATYIRIESVALIFSVLSNFVFVLLITLNKVKYMYMLTVARLVLSAVIDMFLVSLLPCSLKLGVNGIAITTVICLLWFVSIPLWKPFMTNILLFKDVDKLYNLVVILVGFYVLYAFQNVFDATFYGLGKTNYMLFESVVTNTLYYGTAFVLYITKIWLPTLTGIALMFGIGMAFDSLVSLVAYRCLLKKNKINFLPQLDMNN